MNEPLPSPYVCRDCGARTDTFARTAESARDDEQRFSPKCCAQCGLPLVPSPLTARSIVGEVVGAVTSADFPAWRTLRDLVRGPGTVAQRWIEGRRRTYMHPVKLIVLIGVIVALVVEPVLQARLAALDSGQAHHDASLARSAQDYFAFICLILLAPVALAARALGRVAGLAPSWVEWYVLGLYAYALAVLLQVALGFVELTAPAVIANVPFQLFKGTLPILFFAWGAAGFVVKGQRLKAVMVASGAHVIALLAVGALQALWLSLR